MQLQLRNGVCLLAALFVSLPAQADESADQLERARLLREFQEVPSPASSSESESQWRAQTFERDRQARDLSADILRRDLEYRSGGRR